MNIPKLLKLVLFCAFFALISASTARAGGLTPVDLGSNVSQSLISADGKNLWVGRYRELAIHSLADHGNLPVATDSEISQIARTKSGSLYASSHNSLAVKIWRPDGTLVRTIQLKGTGAIRSLEFSPSEKLLVTSAASQVPVQIWDVATGELIREFPGNFSAAHVAFTSNSKQLVEAATLSATSGVVRVWDVRTGKLVRTWQTLGTIRSLASSPNGKHVAIVTADFGSRDTTTTILSLTGKAIKTIENPAMVTLVVYSPKGELVTGDNTGKVRLFSKKYRLLQEEMIDGYYSLSEIHDITFSSDGKRVAISSLSWKATIWDR